MQYSFSEPLLYKNACTYLMASVDTHYLFIYLFLYSFIHWLAYSDSELTHIWQLYTEVIWVRTLPPMNGHCWKSNPRPSNQSDWVSHLVLCRPPAVPTQITTQTYTPQWKGSGFAPDHTQNEAGRSRQNTCVGPQNSSHGQPPSPGFLWTREQCSVRRRQSHRSTASGSTNQQRIN